MDSLFPTAGIYSPHGQRYESVDRDLLLSYREKTDGQILHEGITEAGAMGSVIASGTSYATSGVVTVPVYLFYSMFGFQRTGDALWSLGDQMGKGFLLGATAGRTTLNGEGLQHADGHSLLLAATNPACVSYDPAFAFEVALITQGALERMYVPTDDHPHGEHVFHYLTVYNETYPQPAVPEGADLDVLREQVLGGIHRWRTADDVGLDDDAPRVHLLASGVAVRTAERARDLLAEWGVAADVFSVTSWSELARDAADCSEHALLNPTEQARVPRIRAALEGCDGPVVAVSDWMRAVPDQLAPWLKDWTSLGTDGYGRSDTREALRRWFLVDAESVTSAALSALARGGRYDLDRAAEAVRVYDLSATPDLDGD